MKMSLVADELQDLEAEIAELTRELNESPAAEHEEAIAAELQRLTERLNELRAAERARGGRSKDR